MRLADSILRFFGGIARVPGHLVRLSLLLLAALAVSPVQAGKIDGLSVPVDSSDASSHPLDSGVWSVQAPPFPFNVEVGIGQLVNGLSSSGFVLHDHVYAAPNVPDPTRAVVTYSFTAGVVVDQLEMVQHANGVTQIQGFVGDSLASLTAIGSIFGPSGDVTGRDQFSEGQVEVFDFNNVMAGKYFRFVVLKTSLEDGWASYRAFPRMSSGVRYDVAMIPEPSSWALMILGGLVVVLVARLRQPRASQGRVAELPVGGRVGKLATLSAHRLLLGLGLSSCLLFAGPAGAIVVLDQHNDSGLVAGGLAVAGDRTQVQTFTVGANGELVRVEVQVSKGPATVEDLAVSLWSTTLLGRPATLLSSQSFAPSAVAFGLQNAAFVTWELNTPIAVWAGELLAIVLNSNAVNTPPEFVERYVWSAEGQYPRGEALTQVDGIYFEQPEDLRFRTYLAVPEPDQVVMWVLGLGVLLLSNRIVGTDRGLKGPLKARRSRRLHAAHSTPKMYRS